MIDMETNYSKTQPPTPVYKKYLVRPSGVRPSVRPSVHVRPSEGGVRCKKKTADNDDSFLPYNDLYDAGFDKTGTDR